MHEITVFYFIFFINNAGKMARQHFVVVGYCMHQTAGKLIVSNNVSSGIWYSQDTSTYEKEKEN